MIVNYRIALLPPFMVTIYMNATVFEGAFTFWKGVQVLIILAYLGIFFIKRNEYGWLRYEHDLEIMLSRSCSVEKTFHVVLMS